MVKIATDLNSLKTEVGKLDVGKLMTVTQDLKQLSIVVDKNV